MPATNSQAGPATARPRHEPDGSLTDEQLLARRQELHRGLARSNLATVVALLISVGLAGATLFYAFEARQANARTREELWNAERARAMALRLSGKVGRRQEGLQAIRQAVRLRPTPALRDEAIATLALMDIQPGAFWQPMPPQVMAVAFSEDLEFYAWGDDSGVVQLFTATNRSETGRFAVPGSGVMSLVFSPDGRFLAARFAGGTAAVWDVRASNLVFKSRFPVTGFQEHSLSFHPREPWLVISEETGRLRRLDTRDWREAAGLPIAGRINAHCFNPAGTQLAVAVDSRVEIWDWTERRLVQQVTMGGGMTALAWHPHGQILIGAHADGNLTLVDRRFGRRQTLEGHSMVANRVVFDPRGEVLVSTSWDGTTRFWDARSGRPLLTTESGYAVGFDRSGQTLCYYKERLGVGCWHYLPAVGFARLTVPPGISDRILGVDVSADAAWLAGTTSEGVHLWRRDTGEHLSFLPLPDSQRVAFSADGRWLVVSTGAGLYRLPLAVTTSGALSLPRQAELQPGTEQRAYWLGSVTVGPQKWFVSAAPAETAILNLADTGDLQRLKWPGGRRITAISPDGRILAASAWKGGGTRIWDLTRNQEVADLKDEGGVIAFSPDGRTLAVGASTEFQIYDTASWQSLRRIPRDVANALSGIPIYSPDGQILALTHTVRQVRLVAPETGEVLANLSAPHPERVTIMSASRDSGYLAVATDNREIQLWNLAQLRAELGRLGLAFGARQPGAAPAPSARAWAWWWSALGAGFALVFALYSLRHHRKLLAAYEALETMAAERRRALAEAQNQLMHSQKMKALGTLAAGIAHDFNNLLSIIRMAGQLVDRQLKPQGLPKENLEAIEQAVAQGKSIVGAILGYSRRPGNPNALYRVNEVVSETLAMLNRQYLSGIVLTLELDAQAPAVRGDKSRLEQALLNLIINAAEAMNGSGRLTLQVRTLPQPPPCLLPPRPAAGYVEVSVRDSGPGIRPEHQARIFEPFFTTKTGAGERGTGLGLTTVYTLAQQDGWGLAVSSPPGQGATFRLVLPVEPRGTG